MKKTKLFLVKLIKWILIVLNIFVKWIPSLVNFLQNFENKLKK